jgi:1-deoxy-D-xylulose-5-phosphate reductoisomerase
VAILPVDSEHNAIHQCLRGRERGELKRIILTASGGPFRGRRGSDLAGVSAEDALKHPTWQMGRKITIDSATLMNKGLEVIEARWLFDVDATQIDVVIHPQSVIHSMVELVDGSIIAQMGITDMRLPIQYAFSYPERWHAPLPRLDLSAATRLEFETPDTAAFPCLGLAYAALEAKQSMAVVLNAANEVAVATFLEGRLAFPAIPHVIERTMAAHHPVEVPSLADVRNVDLWAREYSREVARGVQLKI